MGRFTTSNSCLVTLNQFSCWNMLLCVEVCELFSGGTAEDNGNTEVLLKPTDMFPEDEAAAEDFTVTKFGTSFCSDTKRG